MAIRIVGVDLPQNKRGEIALTYIFGIGRSSSAKPAQHQAPDGYRLLSGYPSSYWSSCTRTEHEEQRSYSQG